MLVKVRRLITKNMMKLPSAGNLKQSFIARLLWESKARAQLSQLLLLR